MKIISVFKSIVFAVAAIASIGIASAQQQKLLWAAGDAKNGSTYGIMAIELNKYCGNGNITVLNTTGGVENRNLLLGNKVNIGMMQADMLEFTRRTDPTKVASIKTLFPLHKEEVHIIARADEKKEGGYFGTSIGSKSVTFTTLSDFAGRTLGAVGGSFDSASVISNVSGVKFGVEKVENNAELEAALKSGKFDAIVVVGGAQHPMVARLNKAFRIIPIPKDVVEKLVASKLYTSAALTYDNLGANGVPTVATQALVVTRDYKSPEMIKKLVDLRQCFYNKHTSLADDTGNHEKWYGLDPKAVVAWPMFNPQ